MTERENMEVPLRVRISTAEDTRLMEAANKLGLTKSVYVRWAIENSTAQVLGPVVRAPEPEKAAPVKRKKVEKVAMVAPPPPREEPVPDAASLFTNYNNAVENMVAAVEEVGGAQVAAFDDSDWS